MTSAQSCPNFSPENVPLRTGPPTREELLVHYPAKFTWTQLKTFVNSGDLGLLKRDRNLQQRYVVWAAGIKEKYGSIVNYLHNHRLQWGQPDTLSLLGSALDDRRPISPPSVDADAVNATASMSNERRALPPIPADAPPYFTADTPAELISIIQNDWPYSVPSNVEHTLIWTRLPIFHPAIVLPSIVSRVSQDGLWGFTGLTSPPPSPSTLPMCLPALSEWGVTMDGLVRSKRGDEAEEAMVRRAGAEVDEFVRRRWTEEKWETAWFVNPPRLQSVPGLAHIHVFARLKLQEIDELLDFPMLDMSVRIIGKRGR